MATYTTDIIATEFACRKRKVSKQVTVNEMRHATAEIPV